MVNRRGFTLLEVVLAIALSGAVMALLTTAINLFLIRADSGRARVETAQLARNLLGMIADDLRATRYVVPDSGGAGGAGGQGGGSQASRGSQYDGPSEILGIFGTATQLQIDRSEIWRWERLTQQQQQVLDSATLDQTPQCVRYYFVDGEHLLPEAMAAQGISAEAAAGNYTGLYRQELPSAVRVAQGANSMNFNPSNLMNAELLAPEVIELSFAYFDGTQLVTEWDSELNGGLPLGIEIRLSLVVLSSDTKPVEQPRRQQSPSYREEDIQQFRLFVALPQVQHVDSELQSGGVQQMQGESQSF